MRPIILVLLISLSINLYSQSEVNGKFSDAIEDNSFLIEEAYNQEDRVVQHISTGLYNSEDNLFQYNFTQEWPIFGYKHQFSYTLPYTFINSNNGIGDIMLNYRYQLSYKEDWACLSPRISLIIPTGNKNKNLGGGAWGAQINLPASKRLSNHFVIHANLGLTYLNQVESSEVINKTIHKDLTSYFGGLSIIWLATENLNFMFETIKYANANINSGGKVGYMNQTIINPGVRYALNINKLQIVPGISVPVTFGNNKTTFPVFFYLSFEHPY